MLKTRARYTVQPVFDRLRDGETFWLSFYQLPDDVMEVKRFRSPFTHIYTGI